MVFFVTHELFGFWAVTQTKHDDISRCPFGLQKIITGILTDFQFIDKMMN